MDGAGPTQHGDTRLRGALACLVLAAFALAAIVALGAASTLSEERRALPGGNGVRVATLNGELGLFGPSPLGERALAQVLNETSEAGSASALLRDLERISRAHEELGISVALIEGGELQRVEGFGLADRDAGLPMSGDTLVRVGSVSKSIIGLLALRGVAHGQLDLNEGLSELLPALEYDNEFSTTHPVSLAHLLEHSSGFDELRFNEMVARSDVEASWPLERVLALNPRSRRARWRPGLRHAYTQVGYTVAAHAIETRAGRPWTQLVEEKIFKPLHMSDASFELDARTRAKLATGYDGPPGATTRVTQLQLHHRPGGNLLISARDLGRLVQMLIRRGHGPTGEALWSEAQLRRLERGASLPVSSLAPTYGLGIYPQQFGGELYFGHGGWLPGYQAWYAYHPQKQIGVVMLANRTGPALPGLWQARERLLTYLMARAGGPLPVVPAPPLSEAQREQMQSLTGNYRFASPAMSLTALFERMHTTRRLELREDALMLVGEGGSESLARVGPRALRRIDEREASLTFFADANGRMHMYDADYGFRAYTREPLSLSMAVRAWIFFSQLTMLLALASALWWIPGRLLSPRFRSLLIWPSIAAWSMSLTFIALGRTPLEQLGQLNLRTLLVFALSWGFAIACARGCLLCARAWRNARGHWTSRVLPTLCSLALCGWLVLLVQAGWIGLRTWLW